MDDALGLRATLTVDIRQAVALVHDLQEVMATIVEEKANWEDNPEVANRLREIAQEFRELHVARGHHS